jgi:hypothetical protein
MPSLSSIVLYLFKPFKESGVVLPDSALKKQNKTTAYWTNNNLYDQQTYKTNTNNPYGKHKAICVATHSLPHVYSSRGDIENIANY